MKRFFAALLVMAMVLGLNGAALAKAGKRFPAGTYVEFTGSARCYKRPGAGKTGITVHRGSMTLSLDSVIKNGREWVRFNADPMGYEPVYVRADYLKRSGEKMVRLVFSGGGRGRSVPIKGAKWTIPAKYGRVRVTGGRVNLRKGPSLAGKSQGVVRKGTSLKLWSRIARVDSRVVSFFPVLVNGRKLWISSQYSKLIR